MWILYLLHLPCMQSTLLFIVHDVEFSTLELGKNHQNVNKNTTLIQFNHTKPRRQIKKLLNNPFWCNVRRKFGRNSLYTAEDYLGDIDYKL